MRALRSILFAAMGVALIPLLTSAKQTLMQQRRFELEALIQPLYLIDVQSQSGGVALNRARLSATSEASLGRGTLEAAFEVDFSEDKSANMLKDAALSVQLHPALGITLGQFKIPFGFESQRATHKLPTIWRTALTQHLRDELAVAGRSQGVMLYGRPLKALSYQVGFFDYAGHHGHSLKPLTLIEHAVVGLEYRFSKQLDLSYGLSVPQMSHVLYTGEIRHNRYFLHDVGMEIKPCSWYEARAELFIGPDTAEGKLFFPYLDDYQEIVSQGLSLVNTLSFTLPHELELMVTAQGEYLNGLGYQNQRYIDRGSYFVLGSGIKLLASRRFYIDISGEMQFDKNFSFNQTGRFGIQLTSLSSFTHKKDLP